MHYLDTKRNFEPTHQQQQQLPTTDTELNASLFGETAAANLIMVFKSTFEGAKPPAEFGDSLAELFWQKLKGEHNKRCLFLDFPTGRSWTGDEILKVASGIAANLAATCKLKPESDCVFFYENSDIIHLTALGVLFSGCSICVGAPHDPEDEHKHMIDLMQPALVFVPSKLAGEMVRIRQNLQLNYKIVAMDEESCAQADECNYQLHRDLLCAPSVERAKESAHLLAAPRPPVRVPSERAAYVLLTSGSTGRPKAVGRSHRNSVYVCHSLDGQVGERLWRLDSNSVLAGHLQLDHGTGTFCLKQTIAKGCKLIIMREYKFETMLDAIEREQITDCVLGSALLHNFITSTQQLEGRDLSSLRSFLAVGSPIANELKVLQFMRANSSCSIQMAYGMTECGFVGISERSTESYSRDVYLLPNFEAKLVARGDELEKPELDDEIVELEKEGELYLRGATVSSGYLGAKFAQQSRAAFKADGFYKSNDICSFSRDGKLKVRGRFSEVLCLYDGWKVVPSELEALLMSHPQIGDAAIVGVPDPQLPTCHLPRAYVVRKQQSAKANGNSTLTTNGTTSVLTEKQVFDFVAARTAEPKHLRGGIKFVESFPRISIGKVDKKALLKIDVHPI